MTLILRLAINTLALPVIPVLLGAGVATASASNKDRVRRTAATLGLVAGVVIAHLVNVAVPRLPPVDTIGWIPIAVTLASLALFMDEHPRVLGLFTFLITTTAAWLIGRPAWTHVADFLWPLLCGASAAAIVASLESAGRRMPRAASLLAFAMTMASAAVTCLFAHGALLAQVVGASAIVVGASAIAALRIEPTKASELVAVIAAITVVLYGRLYATVALCPLALLAMSALAPLVASLLPASQRVRGVASIAMASGLGAIAALAAR